MEFFNSAVDVLEDGGVSLLVVALLSGLFG